MAFLYFPENGWLKSGFLFRRIIWALVKSPPEFFLKKSRFVLSHHVYRADLPEPSVPEVAPVLRRSGHEREEGEEEMEARKDKGSKQVRFLCSLTHWLAFGVHTQQQQSRNIDRHCSVDLGLGRHKQIFFKKSSGPTKHTSEGIP